VCGKSAPSYFVDFTPEAKRDLKRLKKTNKPVAQSIAITIRDLRANPRPSGIVHLGGNTHRVRDGEYRIIYDIEDSKRAVWILRIRDRKEAYKQ
jgi:mRNA interferase RelE/StbE